MVSGVPFALSVPIPAGKVSGLIGSAIDLLNDIGLPHVGVQAVRLPSNVPAVVTRLRFRVLKLSLPGDPLSCADPVTSNTTSWILPCNCNDNAGAPGGAPVSGTLMSNASASGLAKRMLLPPIKLRVLPTRVASSVPMSSVCKLPGVDAVSGPEPVKVKENGLV